MYLICIISLFFFCGVPVVYASAPPLTKDNAILAIIGEAEAEPINGKIAIAEALRNRGHLRGVYGVKSKRVLTRAYSASIYRQSEEAWEKSSRSNLTNGATGWGNDADLVKFKQEGWFDRCEVTVRIGRHSFYKCR